MGKLRYLWQESLLKTLAVTHKISKPSADKRYRKFLTIDGRRIVGVEIKRKAKKPLRATFGKKPLTRKAPIVSQDIKQTIYRNSNELLTRMLADVCELCGSPENVEGHHIRKLATLKNSYKGRREKPEWVRKMIAMRRKTLFVCRNCHEKIHKGKYDGVKLTKI